VLFGSWILQILLSEIVGVPTTLETGVLDTVMQYYDINNRFEFGTTANNLQAFRNAVELGDGDCRNIQQPDAVNETTYISCAHVIPEVWTARSVEVQGYIEEGILDPPIALGALGVEGWYVPKYTVEYDPTLSSWVGLAGEHNRQKMADTFLRPTTWAVYCREISTTNCTVPDPFAQRHPETEWELERLFADGLYTGHFRATARNNCTRSSNCTGSIGDFPCGWGGALQATCYWLNIALESNGNEPYSGGYTYSQLGQIWRAANATRSHVIMMWVAPDPVYEEFLGTDYEFVKVTLPAPTQSCVANKINPENRCVEDPALRLGVAEGVCDESPRPLYKLMLSQLQQMTQDDSIPEALRNPSPSILSQFSLTELQINELFKYWLQQPEEPREAVCQWVVDNLEELQQYIPRSYPRTLEHSASGGTSSALATFSAALGGLALLLVIITTIMVYEGRNRRVVRYAQIEFLYLLLLGSAMVSVGAILTGLESPSNGSCVSQIWLIAFGYTLELVPLLVKVSAINKLMSAARRMRRVKLQRGSLYGGVAIISLLVAAYLIVWTVIDPPQRKAQYELTDRQYMMGTGVAADANDTSASAMFEATVVQVHYYCTSNSEAWHFVAIGWNVILILFATALAFQSRNVNQDFNEARVLSRLIYSHFLFVLLRAMALFVESSMSVPMLSIIFSVDTIFMLLVYFVPKFLADDTAGLINGRSSQFSGPASRFGGGLTSPSDRSGISGYQHTHASILAFAESSDDVNSTALVEPSINPIGEPSTDKEMPERAVPGSGLDEGSASTGAGCDENDEPDEDHFSLSGISVALLKWLRIRRHPRMHNLQKGMPPVLPFH
jgi:7 transmembrane sweet-taste receptor of 3 GCPR